MKDNKHNLIESAIELAAKAHHNQNRKGTDIPYITHPLAVGIILARAGCSDEVIIAGILHDTVEDTSVTLDCLRDNFGENVYMIVKGVSEPDKSLIWEERKNHTIDFLKGAPMDIKFVSLADKLNNITAIASDYVEIGEALWERFNRGKDEQKWYYKGLVQALHDDSANKEYQMLHSQFALEVSKVFGNGT
jgi:(p)ppGpp synthase/HD superfamily hydrolase